MVAIDAVDDQALSAISPLPSNRLQKPSGEQSPA
jgi:hypothetical protein